MKQHRLYALGLFVVLVTLLPSAPALAGRAAPTSPQVSSAWQFGPTLPMAAYRFDGEYVQSLNRVYFLGWRLADNSTDGSVWYYDVTAKTFTDTGVDMKVPVSNYQISALTDSHGLGLYIFGGRDNNGAIITTVQAYYPVANKAIIISSDPWPGTTPSACISLPAMGVATLLNKAYLLGGESFSSSIPACVDDNSAQTWIFDPAAAPGAKWTQGPDLNLPRGYITPAVLGGKIYAIGGNQNVAGTLFAVQTVEAWKPGSPAWNDAGVADIPIPCDESQAFAFTSGPLARGFLVAGCGQWPADVPDTYFYSAASNSWSDIGLLNQSRRNQAGALLPGKVMYVLGGATASGGTILDSTEFGIGAPVAGRPGFSRPAPPLSVWASTN